MPKGRPPKDPELRRLEGRAPHGSRILAHGEAMVPTHLDEDAVACIHIIRDALPEKTFASLDVFLLTSFAQAWAMHKRSIEVLRNEPPVIVELINGGKERRAINPWVKVMHEAARVMTALAPRLYLDPVSRQQVQAAADAKESKFGDLLNDVASFSDRNADRRS